MYNCYHSWSHFLHLKFQMASCVTIPLALEFVWIVVPMAAKVFKPEQQHAIAHLLPMVGLIAPPVGNPIPPFQVILKQRHRPGHAQIALLVGYSKYHFNKKEYMLCSENYKFFSLCLWNGRLGSNIKWKSLNNTCFDNIKIFTTLIKKQNNIKSRIFIRTSTFEK